MKKLLALILACVMVMALAACGGNDEPETTEAPAESTAAPTTEATEAPTTEATTAPTESVSKVMSHEEFIAAPMDSEVTVETYVQAMQGWYKDEAVVYCQSEDGGYLIYKLACTEEQYNQLVPGTKIRVTGFKAEWSGEIEITDAKNFEILEGSYIAEPLDVTELMADEAKLLEHQNEKIAVKGLTVKEINYKNDEPGDDIYLTLTLGDADYNFCVERYLTGPETEVYTTVGALNVGDVVNVEAFLYWYEGANPHITSISVMK